MCVCIERCWCWCSNSQYHSKSFLNQHRCMTPFVFLTLPTASQFLLTMNPGRKAWEVVDKASPKVVKKKKQRSITWCAVVGCVYCPLS